MRAHAFPAADRAWWARTLLVLSHPGPVFAALRDDSREAAQARQEPVLAIVVLAGIAGVLSTTFAGTLASRLDPLDVALWAFLGGSLEGFALYFLVGALLYVGGLAAGAAWSYRQARHLLAFAAVPLAVSLPVWTARLASGGSQAFDLVRALVLAWAAALLVVGLRALHGWPWPRALAAAALPLLVPALALARAHGLV